MQGYRLYVLTLVIGSVGFADLWFRIVHEPLHPLVLLLLIPAGAGFLVAAAFYCLARLAWYGAMAATSLGVEPRSGLEPLMYRLHENIADRVRSPQKYPREKDRVLHQEKTLIGRVWRRLVGVGDTANQNELVFESTVIGIVAWAFWVIASVVVWMISMA